MARGQELRCRGQGPTDSPGNPLEAFHRRRNLQVSFAYFVIRCITAMDKFQISSGYLDMFAVECGHQVRRLLATEDEVVGDLQPRAGKATPNAPTYLCGTGHVPKRL